MLEKISRVVLLKDFYGPLLTEKQQNVLNLHYENDLSLSEIADDMNTSRQAVYDMVKKAESLLEQYEQKLGLVERFQIMRERLNELSSLLEGTEVNQRTVSQSVEILRELSRLL
ncbi:MAG: DNA-binding protein [Firmicutes bacterium HGW-Firmicutes-15]|nr:MAG: DNA-binding protein [Firmicutes bacterium HGW-Firmicutes-15]